MNHHNPQRVKSWIQQLTRNVENTGHWQAAKQLIAQNPGALTPTVSWNLLGGAHITSSPPTLGQEPVVVWCLRSIPEPVRTKAAKMLTPTQTRQLAANINNHIAAAFVCADSSTVAETLTANQRAQCVTHPNLLIRQRVIGNQGYTHQEQLAALTGPLQKEYHPHNSYGDGLRETPELIIEQFTAGKHDTWETWFKLLTTPLHPIALAAVRSLPEQYHQQAIHQTFELVEQWTENISGTQTGLWDLNLWSYHAANWKMSDGYGFPAERVISQAPIRPPEQPFQVTVDTELLNLIITDTETRENTRLDIIAETLDTATGLATVPQRWEHLLNHPRLGQRIVEHCLSAEDGIIAGDTLANLERVCPDWDWRELLETSEPYRTHNNYQQFVIQLILPASEGDPTNCAKLKDYVPLKYWVTTEIGGLENYLHDRWPNVPVSYLLDMAYHTDQPVLIDEACAMYK